MSTPTPRTDAAETKLHMRWVSDHQNNGTYTLELNEEQTSLGELERENARLRAALESVRNSYGKHVAEHMPDDGGDAEPQPECFCPFCVSSRALAPNAADADKP